MWKIPTKPLVSKEVFNMNGGCDSTFPPFSLARGHLWQLRGLRLARFGGSWLGGAVGRGLAALWASDAMVDCWGMESVGLWEWNWMMGKS